MNKKVKEVEFDIFKFLYLYEDLEDNRLYYISLKHVRARLEFSEELLDSIQNFISFTDFSSLVDLLENHVLKFIRKIDQDFTNIIKEAKKLNPEGFKYLEIENILNEDILKKKKNKAAMIYHPDKGGSNEIMITVLQAYEQFKALISLSKIEIVDREIQINAHDYIFELFMLAISTTTLQYALDRSLAYYQIYKKYELIISPNERQICTILKVITDLHAKLCHYESKEILYRLLEDIQIYTINFEKEAQINYENRLRVSELKIQQNDQSEIFRRGFFGIHKHNIPNRNYVDICISHISSPPRITINNEIQAMHALKLGIITQKKYNQISLKDKDIEEHLENMKISLNAQKAVINFIIPLYSEQNVYSEVCNKRLEKFLVPETQYYQCDIRDLSEDQQIEYFLSMKEHEDIKKMMKYYYVRLLSYINSAVYAYNLDSVKDMAQELTFLNDLLKLSKSGTEGFYGSRVLTFLNKLILLDSHSLNLNLEYIKIIMKRESDHWLKRHSRSSLTKERKLITSGKSIRNIEAIQNILPITLHPSFVTFLCMKLEKMKTVVESNLLTNELASIDNELFEETI